MLVGSSAKETTDIARVVVDYLEWLDPGEGVTSTTTAVVSVDTLGPWSPAQLAENPPADTTPLLVQSTTMQDANTKQVFMLTAGTPGLTYLVSVVATGSTSGRQQTVEFRMTIATAP